MSIRLYNIYHDENYTPHVDVVTITVAASLLYNVTVPSKIITKNSSEE